jgi:adenylosuccinate lyase
MGFIPRAEADEIVAKASFDATRIAEIEAEVKHDVIAFVTSVEEKVGPAARYFHYGLTSSDVLDTSLSLRLVRASSLIRQGLTMLIEALANRAVEFKDTPIIGRSHGIHAEPTTFGLKLAFFLAEFKRNLKRFDDAADDIAVGKISGPVGNYSASSLSPALEERALAKLGLKPSLVSSQIISRDIYAHYFQVLALLATSVEHLAVEIRLLSRTEVGEVEEFFGKGQKGSSAMPHKKNPVLSENLTGLARVVKAETQAFLDDVVLWHERDISHSSVERIIAPDVTTLIDFMLNRLTGLISGLAVKPTKMLSNLELTAGLYNSQEILLTLCRSGLSRAKAYALVQAKAMAAASGQGDFKELVEADPAIMDRLGPGGLEPIFSLHRFSRFTTDIFQRLDLSDCCS